MSIFLHCQNETKPKIGTSPESTFEQNGSSSAAEISTSTVSVFLLLFFSSCHCFLSLLAAKSVTGFFCTIASFLRYNHFWPPPQEADDKPAAGGHRRSQKRKRRTDFDTEEVSPSHASSESFQLPAQRLFGIYVWLGQVW